MVRSVLKLALAGLAGRAVDSAYRIAVARTVGPEAIGLVQMTAPLYSLAYGLATLALAPVIAKATASANNDSQATSSVQGVSRPHNISRLRTAGFILGALSGAIAFLLLGASAKLIATKILADSRTIVVLRILPFALLPAGLSAVQRGWLFGRRRSTRVAAAQVIEPLMRAVAVAAVLCLLAPRTVPGLAAALALGTIVGEASECFTLLYPFRSRGRRLHVPSPAADTPPQHGIVSPYAPEYPYLLKEATPLVLNQVIFSLASTFEAGIIPRRLTLAGFSIQQTTRLYGKLFGMGMPLIFIPMMLIGPVTAVLLPEVSAAYSRSDRRTLSRTAKRAATVIGAVAVTTMIAYLSFGGQLAALMRGGPELADIIRLLALWTPLAYADHLGSTLLVAMGRNTRSLYHGLAASVVRFSTAYALVANPSLGVLGAILGFIAGDLVACSLHWQALRPLLQSRSVK